jgi:capsular polysaccharide biosynthesis protein
MLAVGGNDVSDLSAGSNFAQQQARNLSILATRQRVLEPVVRRLKLPESAGQLSGSVTAAVPTNTSIITLEVNYPSADGAATVANAVADSLAQTAEELLPTVRRGGADVALRVVYQGSVPQAPSSPNTNTTMMIALATGALAGAALLLLLESLARLRTTSRKTETNEVSDPLEEYDTSAEDDSRTPATSGGSYSGWTW